MLARKLEVTMKRLFILVASLLCCGMAQAQSWPDRPLHVIVAHPPGGPSDIVLRNATDRMQALLGQPIVIDNTAGAGGNLGAAEVARARPDGYTWLWATDSILTVNPHVYQRLGFKPEDLVPVTAASQFSQTLVCNPATGVKSLKELIAKARREKMSYASGGYGVPGHLAMELLLADAGMPMQHIPYKGPAPAAQDVIGGQVPCGFLAGPTVLPHIRAGRLVALAVSGTRRSPVLPDVPTVAEAGFPDYDATFLLVLSAPRGTPLPIVMRMHDALVEALKSPSVVDTLKLTDQEVVGNSPEQAAAQITAISKKWGAVAKRIDLKLE
jgi:tripartite-type tricarboxylate transporter receptor subunit TctC